MSVSTLARTAPADGPDPATLLLRAQEEVPGIVHGSAAYRRASVALFLAGFATFSLLYCVQPLLPAFAQSYRIDAATSSLALSLSTGALAISIFATSALSELLPKRMLMFASMALAAACNLCAAAAPTWPLLLIARLSEGAVLGGVPAVAMAWLAEEMHPRDLGKAMGLYVGGTAFGGMMGRVGMGLLLDIGNWRTAMAAMGGLGLVAAIGFAALLPLSREGRVERGLNLRHHARIWVRHLGSGDLPRLFAVGFVLTSVFVTLFNYAGFRLSEPPFDLSATAISLVFLSYVSGMLVSPWAGSLADRYGRRLPLAGAIVLMGAGALITACSSLSLIVLGILLVTIGFFAAHAIASGWVGLIAGDGKGHASSLYLLAYYMGSSVTGLIGGFFWLRFGWSGVVGLTCILSLIGIVLSLSLRDRL